MLARLYKFLLTLLVTPMLLMAWTFIAIIIFLLPVFVLINPKLVSINQENSWYSDFIGNMSIDGNK
jgi:hypothetical protein